MNNETFEADGVKLILGDCLDILPELSGIDAVITDPPYGMDWDTDSTRFSGGEHKRGEGRSNYGSIQNDSIPFDPLPWLQFEKVVLFGSNHYSQRLPVGTTLIWVKKHDHLFGSFLSDAEIAWMKGGHGVYCFKKSFPPPSRAIDSGGDPCIPSGIHPTQKPVALMAWCMEKAKVLKLDTVCDPYVGSGTTGIACIRTGRRFIGIEKDPAHFRTAVERIKRELSQPTFAFNEIAPIPDATPGFAF